MSFISNWRNHVPVKFRMRIVPSSINRRDLISSTIDCGVIFFFFLSPGWKLKIFPDISAPDLSVVKTRFNDISEESFFYL